jgi:hypothetical protein
MTRCQWIFCEQSGRWAAAFRVAVLRDASADGCQPRLIEVRSLSELAESLARRPASLAAIEVRRANFGVILNWLAAETKKSTAVRYVALLDHSLLPNPWDAASRSSNSLNDVGDAFREAGAVDVVSAPRRLGPALELGRRHAAAIPQKTARRDAECSFAANAWAALPWQAG